MIDTEKIINGLGEISDFFFDMYVKETGCYSYKEYCDVAENAIALLKEHEQSGTWEWITEDKYRCSECKSVTYVDECMNEPQYLFCPYCGCKMT